MADDHLDRLLLDGVGSTGRYTPHRFHVRLQGKQEIVDSVVYLHEVHHGMLNDGTAWGSLLHIYARLPDGPGDHFAEFLDACRITHESHATYNSVGIARAHFGDVRGVLDAYPTYVPLYRTVTGLVSGVRGQNRKQVVVEAMARVCMQTPVLDILCARGFTDFTLADVRGADRPDERWSRLVRYGPELLIRAAEAADEETARRHGTEALDADTADVGLVATTAAIYDPVWETWQIAVYEVLRHELTARSAAQVLDFSGHQEGTGAAIELGHQLLPVMRLRGAGPDDATLGDGALAGAVIQQVRHDLHDVDRYPAAEVELSLHELVAAVTQSTVINDQPCLFLHARLPLRLGQLYDWDGGAVPGERAPVTAVRLIADDGSGGSMIAHRTIWSVDELRALERAWADRGPLVCCVAASCLADRQWRDTWLPELPGSVLVLIDVEADRFLPGWQQSGLGARAARVHVDDRSRTRAALVIRLDGTPLSWFAVADPISIGLLTDHVRDGMGERFDGTAAFSDAELGHLRLAITHVLATESFVGFDGLEGYV